MYKRFRKKKIILPLLVFLSGMGILGLTTYHMIKEQQKHDQTLANLNAMIYAEHMKSDIEEGIRATDTLKQILISEEGRINKFEQVAKNMMTDYIQSIQIAPKGVVTEIYPIKGNEIGKIDLINDKDRGQISRYARDNQMIVMQGPFKVKQGGCGIAIRNPVYLKNKKGHRSFWGFTIVIIRVPDIFSDTINALMDFGYQYRLSKTVSPWETDYEVIDHSKGKISDPVSYVFEIGGVQWKLEVMPKTGWLRGEDLSGVVGGGLLIVFLLTGFTRALLILDEHRKRFKLLAVTDALTGIYNRHGFDEQVSLYLTQHPGENCVDIQFDVDDFKMINDMYGHVSGDKALQILAREMKETLPENAILGRSGGDEFCVFLPNSNCKEAKSCIEQFAKMKRTFLYEGKERNFSISLGYAEYPLHADNYTKLKSCADAALYEVKLRGKQGCLAYQTDFRLEVRTQLGFALNDISENLPGAFIIYKANKEDDEILYANRELLRMLKCDSLDMLLKYTNGSFRNLIREQEREDIEQRIWEQIEEGHSNDYVYYHMKKEDGSFTHVLDYGRIVENGRYGKVFYVLIMDFDLMNRHFKDLFL